MDYLLLSFHSFFSHSSWLCKYTLESNDCTQLFIPSALLPLFLPCIHNALLCARCRHPLHRAVFKLVKSSDPLSMTRNSNEAVSLMSA